MNKPIEIRVATIADLNRILEIENLCFDNEKFTRKQFLYLIHNAKGSFFVAESNNSIVGYISLLLRANSKNLRIYSIAVHPEARGQQIGQKLIEVCKEFAKAKGLQYVSLEVRTDNTAAIKLYERNDFTITDIIQGYYGNGIDAFKLEFHF